MIIEKVQALTCWGWFYRSGKAYALPEPPGECSELVIPASSQDWVSIGRISTWNRKITKDSKDTMAPSPAAPGQIGRSGRTTISAMEDYEFNTVDITPFALGIAFGAADELTAAAESFVPGQIYEIEGWMKLQKYEPKNRNYFNRDLWGVLACEWPEGGKDVIMPKFNFFVIPTALDLITGTQA